ncbi:leucine-rich repeat receptor-like serine/threonine-protein kinase bam2 [Quercus suber]|uniref:Leucine-rich repeat receptor-like serine/threonine-protein kinase bam2 n=1 Tax=Quercus suber TaxID=58331 RepID=A0AAW0J8H5_QUESU
MDSTRRYRLWGGLGTDTLLPSVPLHEVMHVFYVAMLCVEEQAVERPTMREVVQILTEVPKPPNSKQGDSTVTSESSPTSAIVDSPTTTTTTKDSKDAQPQSPPPDLLSI